MNTSGFTVKIMTFIVSLLCVSSCLDIETQPHMRILYRIIKQQDKKFQKKGFSLIAHGGQWPSVINKINMEYRTTQYRFQTIDELRRFFIPLYEEYLQPFNDEPSIRPYLSNFPLDTRNLQLGISFYNEKNTTVCMPWFCRVASSEGRIVYLGLTSLKQGIQLLHAETFEEAKRILAEQDKEKQISP